MLVRMVARVSYVGSAIKDAHCTAVDLCFDSLHDAMYIWYKVGFVVSAAAASALPVCRFAFVEFL